MKAYGERVVGRLEAFLTSALDGGYLHTLAGLPSEKEALVPTGGGTLVAKRKTLVPTAGGSMVAKRKRHWYPLHEALWWRKERDTGTHLMGHHGGEQKILARTGNRTLAFQPVVVSLAN
jgi:hypothetical protein